MCEGLGGAGEESGDDVGGVAVEVAAVAVVAGGHAWVGVPGGDLDVAERYAGVKAGRYERVPQ
jgi:hypothetical protein